MKKIIIAIDGPAGSGKTSTARLVSAILGYKYIDTGAMYRAVALEVLRKYSSVASEEKIISVLQDIQIDFAEIDGDMRVILNGEDVSGNIRTPEVTNMASVVGTISAVRQKLVFVQREIGKNGGVVMDGRDIGTVVFPNADLKIFFTAAVDIRAARRTKEIIAGGKRADINDITAEIKERDKRDSTRADSPLRRAADAIEIDTSTMTLEEQTDFIVRLAEDKIMSA